VRFSAVNVRLRITRQLSGSIDGIHLDDFVVGFVYEVGTSVGSYLLAENAAEPVPETSSVPTAPGHRRFRFDVFTTGVVDVPDDQQTNNKVVPIRRPQPLSWAADSEPPRKKKRRKPTSDKG
jgi:hypothetical protein